MAVRLIGYESDWIRTTTCHLCGAVLEYHKVLDVKHWTWVTLVEDGTETLVQHDYIDCPMCDTHWKFSHLSEHQRHVKV